ncbi:SusC/RagA family TonB-linked outer membrane protein [Mucilaginibacter limnophilus]|uniref:SusC/RagA family TonB-linked outer membrane protein n=1 Tax=Mucilaginibacter limnophilus TaxID=1932778 RepID=A0A3S2Y3Z0_9SPHI|nr:SusC/RagA family TonB-linked outer membrane protein [Mucilaginibacter limnophilus]RVU02973.1 SusC/RagA family TonB-linked outer membrane protein [Mucilaginibacter limnophilus]
MKQKLLLVMVMLFWCFNRLQAQSVITGTVTGEDGANIPGATISVKGTANGTQADANGRFHIKASGDAVLIVSFLGFVKQELPVNGRTIINIVLQQDNKQLQEVVVTALGVSREKKAVGYATTSVNSAEINRAAPLNLAAGLQGKVAGVDISVTSGSPGGSSKVILRGFSSVTGNNQPLYVVDGVPVNNSRPGSTAPLRTAGDLGESFDFGNAVNDIDPNNIENISILKGAAATSLYGSRGSAGVILITTKKGKAGDFKVDFTSAASFTNVSFVPYLQDVWGGGWGKLDYINENGSWGPKMDGMVRGYGSFVDGTQLQKEFAPVKNRFKDAFDTGAEYISTIAFSGGNESSAFRVSYGNTNSNGILPTSNDTYRRNVISLNGSTKFKRLTASASLNYINKNSRYPLTGGDQSGIGAAFYDQIIQIPVNMPIAPMKDYKNIRYNIDNYFTSFAENPYYSINENGSHLVNDRLFGNIDLKLKVAKWLDLQFQQGFDVSSLTTKVWFNKNEPSPGSWTDGGNDEGEKKAPYVGSVTEGAEGNFEYDSKLNAIFSKRISGDFDLNGLLGVNYNDRGGNTLYSKVEDLSVPGFFELSNSGNQPVTTQYDFHRRLYAVYGSATIGYRSWTYLTVNARNDWSSTLPKANRSYFYPSANLAVILSDAFDLSKSKISLFKVRASWGRTGNDTDPYRIFNTLSTTGVVLSGTALGGVIQFPYQGIAGTTITDQLNNANLRPEISSETEFGTEMRFFDNRFGFDLAVYNKETKDQILPVVTAPSTGYSRRIVNFGRIRNRGIELAVNGTPVKTDQFNWTVGYTFTRNRNKVLELPNGLSKIVISGAYEAQYVAKVGQPLGVYEAPGMKYDPQGRVITANGYPVAQDGQNYGSSQRDFTMGLTNAFSFKDFTLGFTLDYRKGGVFYSGTADLTNFVGNGYVTLFNDRRNFIVPNSVVEVKDAAGNITYQENTIPVTEGGFYDYWYHSNGKAVTNANTIIDKTFLKLRDVTLTYNLPKKLLSKRKIANTSITLYGRNLLTYLPAKNQYIDPEVSNFGNDLRSEFGEFRTGPATRNIGVKLAMTF